MITIVLLVGVVSSLFDRTPDLHLVRTPQSAGQAAIARRQWQASSFSDSVTAWLGDPQTRSRAPGRSAHRSTAGRSA
jgi:hypothetical protein